MRNLSRKSKKVLKDNLSSTKYSDSQSTELEASVTQFHDHSMSLYNTIQSIWNEYQSHLSYFPCLDILADLASKET